MATGPADLRDRITRAYVERRVLHECRRWSEAGNESLIPDVDEIYEVFGAVAKELTLEEGGSEMTGSDLGTIVFKDAARLEIEIVNQDGIALGGTPIEIRYSSGGAWQVRSGFGRRTDALGRLTIPLVGLAEGERVLVSTSGYVGPSEEWNKSVTDAELEESFENASVIAPEPGERCCDLKEVLQWIEKRLD